MSDSDKTDDELFLQRAKSVFDQSVDDLDGAARSKLNQARNTAIELADAGAVDIGRWQRWVPATGIAAAAVVAVFVWNGSPRVDTVDQVPVSDFEILLTEDSFEMLEDLEFYSWLEIDTQLDADPDAGGNVG